MGRRTGRPGRADLSRMRVEQPPRGSARHHPARQVSLRSRHDGAQRKALDHGPRILQAGHRDIHPEPVPARREARHWRQLRRREHRGIAGARHQRVPGVSRVLPDESAGRLRPVQDGHGALQTDACARARSDGNESSDPRVRDLHPTLSEQRTDARGQGPPAGLARSFEPVRIPRGTFLLPDQLVRGRHRTAGRHSQAGSGVYPSGRRVLLPGRVVSQDEARGGSTPAIRAAGRGIPGKRISRRSPQAADGPQNPVTGEASIMMTSQRLALGLIALFTVPALAAAQESNAPLRTAVVCAPSAPADAGGAPRIVGTQDSHVKTLYGPRDLLIVNAGTNKGLQLGQRYSSRRRVDLRSSQSGRDAIVTSGLLTVVAVNEDTAIVTVDFACDGIERGDYLVAWNEPVIPADAGRTD